MSSTGFSALTMIAIPSSATVVPSRPADASSSFSALEERPISAEPLEAASIPVPEPVGSYVTDTPGFSAINCSERIPITFSIEVEPLVETLPESSLVSSAGSSSFVSSVFVSSVCAVSGDSAVPLSEPPQAAMLITITPARIAANNLL